MFNVSCVAAFVKLCEKGHKDTGKEYFIQNCKYSVIIQLLQGNHVYMLLVQLPRPKQSVCVHCMFTSAQCRCSMCCICTMQYTTPCRLQCKLYSSVLVHCAYSSTYRSVNVLHTHCFQVNAVYVQQCTASILELHCTYTSLQSGWLNSPKIRVPTKGQDQTIFKSSHM